MGARDERIFAHYDVLRAARRRSRWKERLLRLLGR
jgi:hypothetical protein